MWKLLNKFELVTKKIRIILLLIFLLLKKYFIKKISKKLLSIKDLFFTKSNIKQQLNPVKNLFPLQIGMTFNKFVNVDL